MPRPKEFGPGEDCEVCSYYAPNYCKLYKWTVAPDDWCKDYKATPEHLAKFKLKEHNEHGI